MYMHEHIVEIQRCPGPSHPQWKIPRSEWANVLHRIEHGETLRKIASHHGVSYEAVRCVLLAAREHSPGA